MGYDKSISFYGIGIVAKNKEVNSLYIEVTPTETMPTMDGELGKQNIVTSESTDSSGNASISKVDKTGAITARWLNDNTSNVISPPQVRVGEQVKLYVLAGGNEYGWKTLGSDHDLRDRDRYIVFASSKPEKSSDWITKGYYVLLDAIDKKVQIHTSTADSEPVGFDMVFDTKEGAFFLVDTLGNYIKLDSVKGNYEIGLINKMDIKLKKFSVDNGTCNLVQTLSDLCSVLIAQSHIDSMRGHTTISPETKSAIEGIKSKLNTFI